MQNTSLYNSPRLTPILLLLAGAVLALDPAIWLVKSWMDPAYDSSGYIVFVLTLGLFAWSAASRVVAPNQGRHRQVAIALLAVSALVRLASQLLAINTIGALCLVVDVFALAILFRLPERARPLSPFWLSGVFMFSLPLERILQRTIGYGLQQISADGACTLLSGFYDNLVCQGTRIVLNGVDVLVDLPCSGAQTLLLGLLGFCVAAALCRATPLAVGVGFVATLLTACFANLLRIAVLAVGIAEPERLGGLNVMAQPWHDLIGLAALSLVCVVLMVWVRWAWQPVVPRLVASSPKPVRRAFSSSVAKSAAVCALVAALAITGLPRTALDVTAPASARALPSSLSGHVRHSVALTERERAFFNQFGGWSAKAEYGPHGLMLVNTSSPLRHLHGPEDCLRGLGYQVEYLGAVFEPLPTAVYRAISPDGTRYRIDVTFVSDRGSMTTNVATAVWKWLQGEAGNWTAIQRISPEDLAPQRHAHFNRAVIAALDLKTVSPISKRKGTQE